jgi:hypothetical protein
VWDLLRHYPRANLQRARHPKPPAAPKTKQPARNSCTGRESELVLPKSTRGKQRASTKSASRETPHPGEHEESTELQPTQGHHPVAENWPPGQAELGGGGNLSSTRPAGRSNSTHTHARTSGAATLTSTARSSKSGDPERGRGLPPALARSSRERCERAAPEASAGRLRLRV